MSNLVVIENPEESPLRFDGVDTVSARTYLTGKECSRRGAFKVFNLCRSYRYQSMGYYVSLLAEARGHKAFPSILTIQDMKSSGLIRLTSDELEESINKALSGLDQQCKPSFNIYFGKSPGGLHASMAMDLYRRYPTPFLQAVFSWDKGWRLQNISPLAVREIPEGERAFAEETANTFFAAKRHVLPKKHVSRFDLAILHNPEEKIPPSNERALQRFVKAAAGLGIAAELITRDDADRIFEFDALFIRETTSVDHHTYRIARKAASEGLVVIDDPVSILRCTNKVYLAEVLRQNSVPAPKTLIVHSRNIDEALREFAFPVILKQPDSSFSQGVSMARDEKEFLAMLKRLLDKSDLVIAQEFLPSEFDWRIGVLDRQPLYACKYFMAGRHWQIIQRDGTGQIKEGRVETVPVEFVSQQVLKTALRAANLMGDGLYGVDLKQKDKQAYVIEVNDNPSIEQGFEDNVLKEELYDRIMRVFLARIQASKKGNWLL